MTINLSKARRRDITNKIIKALQEGTTPWQKEWINVLPVNAVTGRYYSGINSMILTAEGKDEDPRWATKRQAESQGWSIKSGARPVRLQLFLAVGKKDKDYDVYKVIDEQDLKIIRKEFEVYHTSEIEGITPLTTRVRKRVISNQEIESIIYNASVRIFFGGDRAYYDPSNDTITIPKHESFIDTEAYYSTLLHEMSHWTGHSSRLNRPSTFNRKSASYAFEELIAEISTMFLSAETGLDQTPKHFDNHAAYVASWISLLKYDRDAIFKAVQEAKKAADYILSFREEQTQPQRKLRPLKIKKVKRAS